MSTKKCLVTGASGFIGSHLVEKLVDQGAEVTALLHYNASEHIGNLNYLDPQKLGPVRIVFGDVSDSGFVQDFVSNFDCIFHLAALIGIPYSYVAPRSYLRVNCEGTLNLLEAVRRGGAGRLVHTSTSEVYGSALYTPIDESHPLQGQSPYSASKIAADKIAEAYYRTFGVPVVTVRPFNTYGPRQSRRAFVPSVIVQALSDQPIRVGSLCPVRDMTYVDDTVAGFISASEQEGIVGETFNLGTGRGYTMEQILDLVVDRTKTNNAIVVDPARVRPTQSEVNKLISQNQKMRLSTGWEPKIGIEEGLSRTIQFFEKYRIGEPQRYVI